MVKNFISVYLPKVMENDLDFKGLIAHAIERDWDGKVSAAERAADLKPDTIRNLMRATNTKGPTLETAKKVAEGLGLEFYVGPRRTMPLATDQVAPDTEFARVDRYLVDLSAGNGSLNDNVEKSAPVAFRADWMRDIGIKPEACVVVGVEGDSMVPTLNDRDLVLLDRTPRDLASGGIYAIVDTLGDVRVKRLERLNGQLVVRSDNPSFPIELYTPDEAATLTIIGRVIWSGRTL